MSGMNLLHVLVCFCWYYVILMFAFLLTNRITMIFSGTVLCLLWYCVLIHGHWTPTFFLVNKRTSTLFSESLFEQYIWIVKIRWFPAMCSWKSTRWQISIDIYCIPVDVFCGQYQCFDVWVVCLLCKIIGSICVTVFLQSASCLKMSKYAAKCQLIIFSIQYWYWL